MKLECKAFPTLSTMADVVIDDSMHKIAAIASRRVTSFLNMSLACATTENSHLIEYIKLRKLLFNIPCANLIKLSSIRTVVLAANSYISQSK